MSFLALAAAAETTAPSLSARSLLYALAHYHNRKTGRCFPSQTSLAARAQISDRQVRTALGELSGAGLIEVVTGGGVVTKGRRSDAYVLTFVSDFARRQPEVSSAATRADNAELGSKKPEPTSGKPGRNQEDNPPKVPLGPVVELIWKSVPDLARKRSSKADLTGKLESAVNRGHDPARIARSLTRHYADPEVAREGYRYAKGVHRIVENDRWLEWDAGADDPAAPGPDGEARTVTFDGRTYTPPPGRTLDLIGTAEDPGVRRQVSWVEEWTDSPFKWRRHEQGPAPDEPGTRIWPDVLTAFGINPAEGGPTA